jgi:hypothetical protein
MPQGRSSTLLHSLLCLKTGHRYNYEYLDAGLSFNIMPQGRSSTLLHSLLCLKAGHQHFCILYYASKPAIATTISTSMPV